MGSTDILRYRRGRWCNSAGHGVICDDFIRRHFYVNLKDKIRVHVSGMPLKESVRIYVRFLVDAIPKWGYTEGRQDRLVYPQMDHVLFSAFSHRVKSVAPFRVYVQVELV